MKNLVYEGNVKNVGNWLLQVPGEVKSRISSRGWLVQYGRTIANSISTSGEEITSIMATSNRSSLYISN